MLIEFFGLQNKNEFYEAIKPEYCDSSYSIDELIKKVVHFQLHTDNMEYFNVNKIKQFTEKGVFSPDLFEIGLSNVFRRHLDLYYKEIEPEVDYLKNFKNISVKLFLKKNPAYIVKIKSHIMRIIYLNFILEIFYAKEFDFFLNYCFNLLKMQPDTTLEAICDDVLSYFLEYVVYILNSTPSNNLLKKSKCFIFKFEKKADFNDNSWNSDIVLKYIPIFLEDSVKELLCVYKYSQIFKSQITTENFNNNFNNKFNNNNKFQIKLTNFRKHLQSKLNHYNQFITPGIKGKIINYLKLIKEVCFKTVPEYETKYFSFSKDRESIFKIYEKIYNIEILKEKFLLEDFYYQTLEASVPSEIKMFFSSKNIEELKIIFRFLTSLSVNTARNYKSFKQKIPSLNILTFSFKNFFSQVFYYIVSSLKEIEIESSEMENIVDNFFEVAINKTFLTSTGFMTEIFKIMDLANGFHEKIENCNNISDVDEISKEFYEKFRVALSNIKEEVEIDGRDTLFWGVLENLSRFKIRKT